MLTLTAKIRKILGKKVRILRKGGVFPAVLYGSKTKSVSLEVDLKEFEKIYHEAGESSLLSLEVDGKKHPVLIHQVERDPVTSKTIHVDFYQPSLEKEIVAKVPLVFEGIAPAVKDFGGTFIKNISELEVKALPQNLPHEIKINIQKLKTFEDNILVKDLEVPQGAKILRKPEDIIAFVAHPEKVEEELVKPIEENVEDVKKVEAKKTEEAEETEDKKE